MHLATDNGANEYGNDDAADDLLKLWNTEDADKPSEEEHEEDDNEDEGTDEGLEDSAEDADEPSEDESDEDDDGDESDEDDDDKGDKKKKKTLADTDVVKVKVGDSEEEVPVSKLTRLYGQEKALTQKSMEVAETRKQLLAVGERHVAAAEGLAKRASARWEPYAKIDWALAVKELNTDEYTALRAEATMAYQDVQFYTQELEGYVAEAKKFNDAERASTAQKTIKALSDPKTGISGFNKQTYLDIRDYAVAAGMPEEAFGNIVEELPLRLMHKAMLYDKGAKAVTKTIDKKNKKIVKNRTNATVSRETFSKSNKPDALKRLAVTGSTEDAEAALLAMWSKNSD